MSTTTGSRVPRATRNTVRCRSPRRCAPCPDAGRRRAVGVKPVVSCCGHDGRSRPPRRAAAGAGPQPGTGQPHRRPHRLQRGPRPSHGRRPRDHGDVRRPTKHSIVLRSSQDPEPADVDMHMSLDSRHAREPSSRAGLGTSPPWRRPSVPSSGGSGTVDTTLPVGAGLSSSAALEVALALVFGHDGDPLTLARDVPTRRTGRHGRADRDHGPTGGERGPGGLRPADRLRRPVDAARRDARRRRGRGGPFRRDTRARPLRLRAASGRVRSRRRIAWGRSGSSTRRSPRAIPDPVLRRRARHVVTECERVRWFTAALACGDLAEAGRVMSASHRSLARGLRGVDARARLVGGASGQVCPASSEPG